MIEWSIRTRIRDRGIVTIAGRRLDNGEIIFEDPVNEGEIILQTTEDRLGDIARWGYGQQLRLNLFVERKEVHVGREFAKDSLKQIQCPHCYGPCTWIDDDFILHSIPYCREWKKTHPNG